MTQAKTAFGVQFQFDRQLLNWNTTAALKLLTTDQNKLKDLSNQLLTYTINIKSNIENR